MKGIVFNLLQEVVTRQFGEDTWDQLLEGMDDYVSKPICLEDIERVLAQWAPPVARAPAS